MPRKYQKKTRVKNPRVPRTHAGETWTKSQYWGFIRSALRRAFSRYPVKYQVKKAAQRTVEGKRHRYEYQCSVCTEWHKDKDVEVDHDPPCGSLKDYDDLAGFVERMFCEADSLRVVCKPCHKKITAEQREARKND